MEENQQGGVPTPPQPGDNTPAVETAKVDVKQPTQTAPQPDAASNGDTAPEAPEREAWPGLPALEPSKTVKQEHETYNPDLSPGSLDPAKGEFIILPADTEKRVEQYHAERPNEQIGDTEGERMWAQRMLDGELTRPVNSQFQASVEREDADWGQSVKSEMGELMAARPRLAQPGESMLTGQRAVQRVRAIIGIGGLIQVPLWNSGFWITLRAPDEGDLLDLFRRTSEQKVTLGRRTYGLAFANSSSFIAEELVNFVLEHLHDSTLKAGNEFVRKYLKVHDLQTIAWAMACAIYPKGFQYSRSILAGENQEKKEVKGLLNVSKLQFVDRRMLSPKQVAHMSRRVGNTMTDEMLENYQSEFLLRERRVKLEEGLEMTLKVPTIDEYLSAGHRWIDSITDMVDRAFGREQSDEQRDRYISHKGKATVMRQFAHWVKDLVETGDREVVFSDAETVDMMMDTLSAVDDIRVKYFEAIHKFIDDTTVSVIATPTVASSEENVLPRFPHLVPIDALYTFFTLLVQKNNRIQVRMDL